MPLNSIFDRAEQFAIHFACRTATRKELTATQKESLQTALEQINSDLFERTVEKLPSGVLFQTVKEYNIGPITITGPTFIMTNNSLSIIKPIKLGRGPSSLTHNLSLADYMTQYMTQINNEMATALNDIASAISGLQYKRAGKIFEFAISGLTPDEKTRILPNLFSYDLSSVGETNLSITKFENSNGELLNVKTQLAFQQLELVNPFNLNVRVDINNRNLATSSMEPPDIKSIWTKADAMIEGHLDSILSI